MTIEKAPERSEGARSRWSAAAMAQKANLLANGNKTSRYHCRSYRPAITWLWPAANQVDFSERGVGRLAACVPRANGLAQGT
jgi:hypothetical protein